MEVKMDVETIKMSSRGQIVIPQDIRETLGAYEGTMFAVTSTKETVVLRKLSMPSKEELIRELTGIAKESKARLKAKGIKEKDLRLK